MTRLVLIFLVVAMHSTFALEWYQGSVVLASGEVWAGDISRQSHDLVLVRANDLIKVLPAHQVTSFRFYDAGECINRRFVSQRLAGLFARTEFFESVMAGTITVLRQQRNFQEVLHEDDPAMYAYFVLKDTKLIRMHEFREVHYTNVKDVLDSCELDVRALNPNVLADILKLIRLYNQLGPAVPIAAM